MAQNTTIRWDQLPVDEVLTLLETRREGLSSAKADERLSRFGPNELETEERGLPLTILLRQFQSPLIYILLLAGAASLLLGKYVDAGVILVVVIFNSVIGFVQEFKAEQALRALAKMTAPRARVLRDGFEREVDPRVLVPGDIVVLETGFRVPADLRLVRHADLQADESILTGESLPVAKSLQAAAESTPGAASNLAYLGSSIVRGRGAGVVVATGTRTVLGHISTAMRQVGEVEAPLQARLAHFATILALLAVGVTGLVFVLGWLRGENLADIFLTAIATAVAAVPEGLPVTVTIALAVGVWRMAQRHAFIRKLPAVETLGSCTTICSDKTGTLTKNQMTVTKICTGGRTFEVTGAGYAPEGQICLAGESVATAEDQSLDLTLRIGLLCNDSDVYLKNGQYRVDGDPTEAALIVVAMKAGFDDERERETFPLLYEIPFESAQQYMATLHARGNERLIFVKGAPERILEMCDTAYVNQTVPLDRAASLEEFYRLASEGLRVLAVAYRTAPPDTDEIGYSDVENGLIFVGLEAMIDPPRPEAIAAVARCQNAGIRVTMITGDHRITAKSIALQIGIVSNCQALTVDGRDLDRMDDDELFDVVERVSVYARISPLQKLRVVQQLRTHGEIVAVTGDGVNDAPALKQADIGVAMGIAGTDVAKEAADMVLADDNFASLFAAVEEGRVVFDNIRKVIMFLIPTGFGLVLAVIGSIALGLPLPFLPAQAIWINLVTNGTQDIAMAFEPAEADVGRRPPRPPTEAILTATMIQRTLLVGVVIAVGTLGAIAWELNAGTGLTYARTVAMTTMVLFQNFHIFNSRSLTRFFFQVNPLSNRFLFLSIVAALGLQILALYWAPLQFVLRTEPLTQSTWVTVLAIASTVLVAVAVDIAIRRQIARFEGPAT